LAATVTNGSGGSSVTPAAIDSKDPAAGFTARCNDTTVATTSGTNLILSEIGWNERNSPFDIWFPDDRYAPVFRQAEALIVRQETTLADDMTGCYTFWVEEG